MNWRDLEEGDVVVPTGGGTSEWLVLHVGEGESGERLMTYVRLDTGSLHTTATGSDRFSSFVKVLRDGEDVNK